MPDRRHSAKFCTLRCAVQLAHTTKMGTLPCACFLAHGKVHYFAECLCFCTCQSLYLCQVLLPWHSAKSFRRILGMVTLLSAKVNALGKVTSFFLFVFSCIYMSLTHSNIKHSTIYIPQAILYIHHRHTTISGSVTSTQHGLL